MTPDDYRRQADELRNQAARAKDPAVKEQLLLMAGDWDQLGRDAAELEHRRRIARSDG